MTADSETGYVDFDAAFAAEAAEPLRLKLYDRVWDLPAELPAGVALLVARMMGDGRTEQDLAGPEILNIAREMFPAETLHAWLAKGLDIQQLLQLIVWAGVEYQKREPGRAEGEAQAPAPGPVTGASVSSSPAGASSPPTSAASTGSGSPPSFV